MQNNRYAERCNAVYSWLEEEKLDAVLIEDTEGRRAPSLRYLCGMPSDALLLLTATGKAILVPWDVHLAEQFAYADAIIPYSDFQRRIETAVKSLAESELPDRPKIELSSATPVPVFEKIRSAAEGEFFCRDGGVDALLDDLRAVKDEDEIALYRKAAGITTSVQELVMKEIESGGVQTELDLAFLIEMQARQLGAEGTGFPTLAAGPSRSFAIHPHPNYTNGDWGSEGLSILDFGLCLDGYTTDITLSLVRGRTTAKQEEMISLVEEAHSKAAAAVKAGLSTRALAGVADECFAGAGYTMPHSLGHGIGLAAHETPVISLRKENDVPLKPGMIITIEPGLYEPETGGVRLENDFLVTESGAEQLTSSRIYRLP